MKIDISQITRIDGASINVDFDAALDGLQSEVSDCAFDDNISFNGILTNVNGIMALEGVVKTRYTCKCYRCLKDINSDICVDIKEDFISTEAYKDSEAYTYQGNYVEIDKALIDNIILSLPMKHVCMEECKGLCPKCGVNLNETQCSCKEETINPKLEVLRSFFNDNEH